MPSAPTIEPFKGTGTWEECDDFVRAIRAAAWQEGKARDDAWMADLASLHFSRKALLWYSQLPKDVRQDWSQLQTSILTRWAPSEDDDAAKIEPTPAAAPSLTPGDRYSLSLLGTLKVTIDKSNTTYYVSKSNTELSVVSTNVNDALRVRCYLLSDGMLIEQIDDSSHRWLAVQWNDRQPNTGEGSTDDAHLSLVDPDTLKSLWTNNCPWQLIKCTVGTSGEITIFWKDGGRKIPLFALSEGIGLYLAADPGSYLKQDPYSQRARLFIESME